MNSLSVQASVDGSRSAAILIVDDDPLVRAYVDMLLSRAGYRTSSASGGAQAIEMAGQSDRSVDLLLTDIQMPGIGGAECADRIRVLKPHVAVLFMTADPEQADLCHIIGRPGVGLIFKPFAVSALLGEIEMLLRRNAPVEATLTTKTEERGGSVC